MLIFKNRFIQTKSFLRILELHIESFIEFYAMLLCMF